MTAGRDETNPAMTAESGTRSGEVELQVSRFEHSTDPQMTGMRGVTLDADTSFQSGRVFSTRFPTVFVTDSGDVELDESIFTRADAAAWFRAVADYLAPEPTICPNIHPYDAVCKRGCGTQCAAIYDRLDQQGARSVPDLMAALKDSLNAAKAARQAGVA